MQKRIVETQDHQLNATLLVTLISPVLIKDYKIQEDGLVCSFTQSIMFLQDIIKTFLISLHEITNHQFYFEIIDDYKAILKIYGSKKLRFSDSILFKTSVSQKEGRT